VFHQTYPYCRRDRLRNFNCDSGSCDTRGTYVYCDDLLWIYPRKLNLAGGTALIDDGHLQSIVPDFGGGPGSVAKYSASDTEQIISACNNVAQIDKRWGTCTDIANRNPSAIYNDIAGHVEQKFAPQGVCG
jgi:hypothetical protein